MAFHATRNKRSTGEIRMNFPDVSWFVLMKYGSANGHPERPATSRSNRYFTLGGTGMALWLTVEDVLLYDGGQRRCV